MDMDYKKVQEVCGHSSSSTPSNYHGNSSKNTSSFNDNNNSSNNNTSSNNNNSSTTATTTSDYSILGKRFPYTTANERRLFLIQYLRMQPLDFDDGKFLAKHGIMDVEMVTFSPDAKFVLPEREHMSDFDKNKCKIIEYCCCCH